MFGTCYNDSMSARNGWEFDAWKITNDLRNYCGLPSLVWDETLYAKALNWSIHLRAEGKLSHSDLADGAPKNWIILGENVGMGSDVKGIYDAYYNSPPHIKNILEPKFTHGAIAFVGSDGNLFTSSEFAKIGPLAPIRRKITKR